jgi:hypothetical protein
VCGPRPNVGAARVAHQRVVYSLDELLRCADSSF